MSRIENPNVITLDQVKQFLQITDDSYDDAIEIFLPVVTQDIEMITNNSFVIELTGDYSAGSADITDITTGKIEVGSVVSTGDIKNVLVTSIDDDAKTVTVSSLFTAAGDDETVKINIFPMGKKPIAAQMVLYNVTKYNIANDGLNDGVMRSEKWGNYSYNRGGSQLNTVSGYPQFITDSLKEITRPRFA